MNSGNKWPEFSPQLFYILALGLSFLTCKMGIIIELSSEETYMGKWMY